MIASMGGRGVIAGMWLGVAPSQLRCVYNRSDGRLIGTYMSARPAPDGVNQSVTVAVDPSLDPSIARGMRWEITVPRNGTVRPCNTEVQ